MIVFLAHRIAGFRNFAVGFLIIVMLTSMINFIFQYEASQKIASANLSARPLKGAIILTEPKPLTVSQKISQKDIINYLKEREFTDVSESMPSVEGFEIPIGCYVVDRAKNQLRLRSSVDDHLFPPLTIEWKGR